ncbi:MAG: hypothetical protein ABIF17_02455 [Patescibacteria group bacterium]
MRDAEILFDKKGGLFVLETQAELKVAWEKDWKSVKQQADSQTKENFGKYDFKVNGIDIWVGLCRPGQEEEFYKPAGAVPIVDLIIKNEFAVSGKGISNKL